VHPCKFIPLFHTFLRSKQIPTSSSIKSALVSAKILPNFENRPRPLTPSPAAGRHMLKLVCYMHMSLYKRICMYMLHAPCMMLHNLNDIWYN
jgi:hypothetical protein